MVRKNENRDFSGTQKRILLVQWYAGADVGISVVRRNGYWDFSGTQKRILGFQWYAVTDIEENTK